MGIPMNAILGLQAPVGLVFGRVRQVSMEHLHFELDLALLHTVELDWSMELTNRAEKVAGRLSVLDVRPLAGGFNHRARITHMHPDERSRLQRFLEDLQAGGTLRSVDDSVSRSGDLWSGVQHAGATPAETEVALDRMRARSAQFQRTAGTEAEYGLSSASVSVSHAVDAATGRRAVRDALRASLLKAKGQGPQRRDAPVASAMRRPEAGRPDAPFSGGSFSGGSRVEELPDDASVSRTPRDAPAPVSGARLSARLPPPMVSPAPLRSTAGGGLGGAARSEDGPIVERREEGGEPVLWVRYPTLASLADDWSRHLRGSGLFVPIVGVGQVRERRVVQLVLPSGLELRLAGEVVAPMPTGTGLSLSLTEEHRRLITFELGAG